MDWHGIAVWTQGEIPTLSELPSPWGPKAYVASERDDMHKPAKFPKGLDPLSDSISTALAT